MLTKAKQQARCVAALTFLLAVPAAAQTPPEWRELAIRAQQNATTEQMIATSMLSALQAEVTGLKAELARLQEEAKKPAQVGEIK